MIIYHLISITIAFFIDKIVGDPPNWPHPVKWMGRVISFLDRQWNNGSNRKMKGLFMVVLVIVVTFSVSYVFLYWTYHVHIIAGIVLESMMIATAIAQKSLKDAALEVYAPLKEGNLKEARVKVSYIVGRDTQSLPESEIVRATVETVAENTSDGVTAPLFWAALGGAPLCLVYRAINTCDSMVGYKNRQYIQFGYFSAKLDDWVNFIPSRLTSYLLLLFCSTRFYTRKEAWRQLFQDAKKHPSPNSGWGEAATAILLGVELGGVNYYKGEISDRARMGRRYVALNKEHILDANNRMSTAVLLFLLFLWLGGILIELTITWS